MQRVSEDEEWSLSESILQSLDVMESFNPEITLFNKSIQYRMGTGRDIDTDTDMDT